MPSPLDEVNYTLPFEILITVTDGRAGLSSLLREQLVDAAPARDDPGLAAVHAIESLLLALAGQGIDLGTREASIAVREAVEAVAEYLCSI